MDSRLKFIKLLFGYKMSQCLYVVAKLNIADYLLSGPKTASELALLSKTNSDALYRVLRCLAALEIFDEGDNKDFSLNEASNFLISDSNTSLKDFVILCGEDLYKTTGDLFYSVETGLPAFDHIYGMNFWNYLDKNNDKCINFHDAMTNGSKEIIKDIINNYNFSPYKNIIDVGGGKGHIICAILLAYPNIHGIVYDLPKTKSLALTYVKEMNLSDRCNVISGNFFDSVPSNGDLYLLKVILHDWNDDQAITILKNCRNKMSKKAKLLIIEKIIQENRFKDIACLGDINMLATLNGKERSLVEFKNLLLSAKLHFEKKIDINNSFSIIEAIPVM